MAKQWVDITQIDNQTPFMKVRWKSNMSFSGDDTWLSEAPGLDTSNMSWGDGSTAALGYFGGHRMNHNASWGNAFTCGFRCDVWGIDDGLTPNEYGVHVKDAPRDQYYDNVVQINGETYYEVDFSTWDGASGKSLYAPYATMPWYAGDIYVEVGTSTIEIDKDAMRFNSTGGSDTVVVTSEGNWTAVVSDAWITASTLSGASGQTSVSISTPDYQDTTANRTGTVTFTYGADSVVLTVTQKKKAVPGQGTGCYFLGVEADAMYLGDTRVDALYLGDTQIS